jgi:long-chain acyl-CoA synthetase
MLYTQFLRHVDNQPTATAVSYGQQELTYQQLRDKVDAFAAVLAKLSVNKNVAVATLLPNSDDFVIATLAIFKLGACLLPLNIKYTDGEIQAYLTQAKISVVITHDAEMSRIGSLDVSAALIDVGSTAEPAGLTPVEPDDSDKALILFSSGSTGGAKQVVRSYRNLVAEGYAATQTLGITAKDVILCSVPLHHAHGFGNCFMAALFNGAKLVITPGEFNPRSIIKALVNHKVTIYPSATFMVKMLSTMRLREQPDLRALRLIFTAGAPLEPSVMTQFTELFKISPQQLYGSSETGAVAINLGDSPANSVGRPLKTIEVYIYRDNGELADVGEQGEIVISSPTAAIAYEGMPEQTTATFKDGLYFSGDLGHIDDKGNVFVTGRRKKMINVAGLKVDPEEVESVLLRLKGVNEVVVLGKADGDYGEMVKAVFVADEPLLEAEIFNHCKPYLAEYKWPKNIEFRSEIPKSPLGKILKKYL